MGFACLSGGHGSHLSKRCDLGCPHWKWTLSKANFTVYYVEDILLFPQTSSAWRMLHLVSGFELEQDVPLPTDECCSSLGTC